MVDEFLSVEIFGLATVKSVVLLLHLFGLALGAGAAFFSDFLFFNILKDKKINQTEYRILKLVSGVVWLGLSLLLISGLLLFAGHYEELIHLDKFLAKMTIVSILILNGILFHFIHIPALGKYINKDLSKSKEFMQKYANSFFISGAISGVSWVAAIVLGGLELATLSYWFIMGAYLIASLIASILALNMKRKILK